MNRGQANKMQTGCSFSHWLTDSVKTTRAGFGCPEKRLNGGCRKVRWAGDGRGKRGGVRVIYYNQLGDGTIWLLTIYGKGTQENIPAATLKLIKETIDAK